MTFEDDFPSITVGYYRRRHPNEPSTECEMIEKEHIQKYCLDKQKLSKLIEKIKNGSFSNRNWHTILKSELNL